MKGTCKHQVFHLQNGKPFVCLANDKATAFWQGFESHEEINAFILDLRKVALEAFGPGRITMQDLLKDDFNQEGDNNP